MCSFFPPSCTILCAVLEGVTTFNEASLQALSEISESLTRRLVDSVIEHEITQRGWLPVFVDGTAIEVCGDYFEKAETLYTGQNGFWLHGVFIGDLWVKQRLYPGNVHPAKDAKDLIEAVLRLLLQGTKGYFLMDSAYYQKEIVCLLKESGQEYSISVTHGLGQMGPISQAKAAEIAGVSREEFLKALQRFGVSPFQITPEELEVEAVNA